MNQSDIIQKDDNITYHSNKEYISASQIKLYKKSPLHKITYISKETPAMEFGTAYHTFILEPEEFGRNYFIFNENERPEPDKTFGSKLNKEWKDNILMTNRNIIPIEMHKQLCDMRDILMSDFYVRSLLKNGTAELSHYTEIDSNNYKNIKVKVRPDYLKTDKRLIVDLKTTNDASLEGFTKNAAKFDYHIQAAFYADVLEQIYGSGKAFTFIFIAQETTYPYAYNVFKASEQMIQIGRYEYEQILDQHQYCLENEEYRGYQVFSDNKFGISELMVPAWKIKELNFYNKY